MNNKKSKYIIVVLVLFILAVITYLGVYIYQSRTSDEELQLTGSYYLDLVTVSLDYLDKQQKKIADEYKIDSYDSWDIDQEKAELVLSEKGVPKVIADIQVIGTLATHDDGSMTWKWSWDNESILPVAKDKLTAVKSFGEIHDEEIRESYVGWNRLTENMWEADELEAERMSAIAIYILKAEGLYVQTFDSTSIWLLIDDIGWLDEEEVLGDLITRDLEKEFYSYEEAVDYVRNDPNFIVDEVDTSKSSWIREAEYYYLKSNNFGYVILNLNGKEYIHREVPKNVWEGFKRSSSFGSYYNQYIKGKYKIYLK